MKNLLKMAFFLSLFCLNHGLSSAQTGLAMANKLAVKNTFRIGSKSVLKLEGKTNVNGFTCGCNETFQSQPFILEQQSEGSLVSSFRSTSISLRIKSLDCGNKIMNKDLQKALHADNHPTINIELVKVEQDKCNRLTELKDWVKMKALTKITLNGHSKDYWISINAKKSGPNQFRFIGSKTMNMTDFCVTPPVAMMGMIKVQDAITIHLDLDVVVD